MLCSELSLLLGICSLCGSLCLLVLFSLPLVDGLGNCLPADSLFHLGSFALPNLDRTNEPVLCLRRTFTCGEGDQRSASDPCNVFLLAGRQGRRHLPRRKDCARSLADGPPGGEQVG
jgi:hypothetical protein